jgi:hypothetical protein
MNTNDKPRRLTKEQVKERGQIEAAKRPTTIQSEPLAEPKVHQKEVVAPLDPKTSAQKGKAAQYERIMRAHKQETESPMTLSGLNPKQRRHQKRRLKQQGNRIRGKQQTPV